MPNESNRDNPRRGARRQPAPPPQRQAPAYRRRPAYGGQARRQSTSTLYAVGFGVVLLALVGFLYVGLQWANGPGRLGAIGLVPTATVPPPSPVPEVASPAPSPTPRIYIVKSGDTPESIAASLHVSQQQLMQLNNITNPNNLQIGQQLQVPPGS